MSAITPTVVLPHVSTCSRGVGNLIKSANVRYRPFLDKLPGQPQGPTLRHIWQPQGPIHHPTLPPATTCIAPTILRIRCPSIMQLHQLLDHVADFVPDMVLIVEHAGLVQIELA